MTKLEQKLAEKSGTTDVIYGGLVNRLIRRRYTISEELAILRQQATKTDDWKEYNAYCEECKLEAKRQLNIN